MQLMKTSHLHQFSLDRKEERNLVTKKCGKKEYIAWLQIFLGTPTISSLME